MTPATGQSAIPGLGSRFRLFPMWTGRNHIPWIWVVMFAYPNFCNTLAESIGSVAMTFTMKKIVSDPAVTRRSRAHGGTKPLTARSVEDCDELLSTA